MHGGCRSCPAVSECSNGTILPAFEVSLSWDADADLDLYVLEPGGVEVFYGQKLGVSCCIGKDRGRSKTGRYRTSFALLAACLLQSTYRARVCDKDRSECGWCC